MIYFTMPYCTTLCRTIPHYITLYYTILYYTILYYTILYYTILYYTILYYTIIYYNILYYTILCCTILCSVILYYTMLGYAMPCHAVLHCTRRELHECEGYRDCRGNHDYIADVIVMTNTTRWLSAIVRAITNARQSQMSWQSQLGGLTATVIANRITRQS
jgi:hypothetical protein